jgi:AbrB family transcriptional regulator (stage V sporulation protein T)
MKATGIVRRIDDLGRVVVPKEIRRTLRIREGEPMEIFTGRDGEIVLKKYSPIEDLGNLAMEYAASMAKVLGCLVCISDHDQIVAAAGSRYQDYQGKSISKELEEAIAEREIICAGEKEKTRMDVVPEETEKNGNQVIWPIIAAGDAIGAVILMNRKEQGTPTLADRKLAQVAAYFLGSQMEN